MHVSFVARPSSSQMLDKRHLPISGHQSSVRCSQRPGSLISSHGKPDDILSPHPSYLLIDAIEHPRRCEAQIDGSCRAACRRLFSHTDTSRAALPQILSVQPVVCVVASMTLATLTFPTVQRCFVTLHLCPALRASFISKKKPHRRERLSAVSACVTVVLRSYSERLTGGTFE